MGPNQTRKLFCWAPIVTPVGEFSLLDKIDTNRQLNWGEECVDELDQESREVRFWAMVNHWLKALQLQNFIELICKKENNNSKEKFTKFSLGIVTLQIFIKETCIKLLRI